MALFANPAPLGLIRFGHDDTAALGHQRGIITAAPGTSTANRAGCPGDSLRWRLPDRRRAGRSSGSVTTFAATAFTSYGAFWLSFVFINTLFGAELPKDPTPMLGLYAMAWALFTAYMSTSRRWAGLLAWGVAGVLPTRIYTFITLGDRLLGDMSLPSAGWNQISAVSSLRCSPLLPRSTARSPFRDQRQLQEDCAARLRAQPVPTAARGPAGPRHLQGFIKEGGLASCGRLAQVGIPRRPAHQAVSVLEHSPAEPRGTAEAEDGDRDPGHRGASGRRSPASASRATTGPTRIVATPRRKGRTRAATETETRGRMLRS